AEAVAVEISGQAARHPTERIEDAGFAHSARRAHERGNGEICIPSSASPIHRTRSTVRQFSAL
ncbi:MAG: hypothetical protein ACRDTI_19575, partial [Mycobacterium sp.]